MDTLTKISTRKKRPKNWSKLDSDLLRPILESLMSKDYYRTKSVCSDWYSVSKTCVRGSLCPWRITYQGHASMLFDLQEHNERYKLKLLKVRDFVLDGFCMASSGDWVLLVDTSLNFCILNLLTCQRINLPSLDPSAPSRWLENDIIGCKNLAVLYVNEETEDFVVAWIFKQNTLFSFKKGALSWRKWDQLVGGVFDIAYRNSKLYLYTLDHNIKILDLNSPRNQGINLSYSFRFVESSGEYIWKRKIAIRDSGEVLIILSLKAIHVEKTLFYVFKMNLESKKWERVDSISDNNEMLIFGHGVTIKAPARNAGDGIKSDTICFVDQDVWPDSDHPSNCGVFDLATNRITWPKNR